MHKHTKRIIDIISRTTVASITLAIFVWVAFFNTGYYSGAMKAVLTAIAVGSLLVSVGVFYPKAKRVIGKKNAVLYAAKETAKMWLGYKSSPPIKKSTNENHPSRAK